ncbi:MAG TPA: PaaI family thioesterase [Actinomycetota bacterium]|nr:PaaI family thioesterase [Actinomycetota bacterium]
MNEEPLPTPSELNEKGRGPLMQKMGIEWLEASAERIVARMPVSSNSQPWGMLHGGASGVLVESIASLGGWIAERDKLALGVELKVNHLRPASSGWVTGVGRPLHTGSTLAVWAVEISDEEGRMTAFGTCTVALRERRD